MADWKGEHLIKMAPNLDHVEAPEPVEKRRYSTPPHVALRREKIKVLHDKGMSTSQIAVALKMEYHTVRKDIKRCGLIPIKTHESKI